jgi:hypothetical protein
MISERPRSECWTSGLCTNTLPVGSDAIRFFEIINKKYPFESIGSRGKHGRIWKRSTLGRSQSNHR